MPEKNHHTGKLNQGHIIFDVVLVPDYESAEVVEPGKQALDFPSPFEATQNSAVLGLALRPASLTMRCDHLRTETVEHLLVERIAVVGFVADQFFGHVRDEPLFERSADQFHFSWAST